jgi:CDGSH iron-sulfur domain-containing protein 3
MLAPTVAQKAPFDVEVEAGKTYWWCACGESKRQPFCDGSHKNTTFVPVRFECAQSGTVWFCGCKHSRKQPLCDGSHSSI